MVCVVAAAQSTVEELNQFHTFVVQPLVSTAQNIVEEQVSGQCYVKDPDTACRACSLTAALRHLPFTKEAEKKCTQQQDLQCDWCKLSLTPPRLGKGFSGFLLLWQSEQCLYFSSSELSCIFLQLKISRKKGTTRAHKSNKDEKQDELCYVTIEHSKYRRSRKYKQEPVRCLFTALVL